MIFFLRLMLKVYFEQFLIRFHITNFILFILQKKQFAKRTQITVVHMASV